jgi:hypothetical protein
MTHYPTLIEQELLPCPVPWCKADLGPKPIRWPVVATKTTQWAVHCDDCDIYGPVGETKAEAIERWNTRTLQGSAALPSEDDDVALVSRMRGAVAYLRDRVGLKMTLDRDQEELLVADLAKAADRIEALNTMRATTPTAPVQDDEPMLTPDEEAELVERINATPNLQPVQDDVAWLVECPKYHPGEYFALCECGCGRHHWTTDVHKATKFPTKEEAEKARGGDIYCIAFEHQFGLRIPSLSPTPETGLNIAWLLRQNLEDEDRRMAVENCNALISLLETGEIPNDLPGARALHATIAARLLEGAIERPVGRCVVLDAPETGLVEALRPAMAHPDDLSNAAAMYDESADSAIASEEHRQRTAPVQDDEPYCPQCCGPCLRKPPHVEPSSPLTQPLPNTRDRAGAASKPLHDLSPLLSGQ